MWNRALAIKSHVHFLSTTFPDRAAKPRKQRPSFGDRGSHFTRKNTGFCARGRFKPALRRAPDLSHFRTTSCCCGFHDDWDYEVVAMVVFADLIFQKSFETDSVSYDFAYVWNRALATVSCAFCQAHLPKVLRDRQFLTVSWFHVYSTTWSIMLLT